MLECWSRAQPSLHLWSRDSDMLDNTSEGTCSHSAGLNRWVYIINLYPRSCDFAVESLSADALCSLPERGPGSYPRPRNGTTVVSATAQWQHLAISFCETKKKTLSSESSARLHVLSWPLFPSPRLFWAVPGHAETFSSLAALFLSSPGARTHSKAHIMTL